MRAVLKWLDANVEKYVILIGYASMAGIIFEEVVRRFLFNQQAAWSTTIPIYLFLWVAWMGASYNTKLRTHLSFDELRLRMPYRLKFACQMLDGVLWIVFGIIVVYYTADQVALSRDNYAIVQGTDNVMQWWFYLATPLAWLLLMFRAVQNIIQDIRSFRAGGKFPIGVSLLKGLGD